MKYERLQKRQKMDNGGGVLNEEDKDGNQTETKY